MLQQSEEQRFGLKPEPLAADADGSAAPVNWLVNGKQIAAHIPVIDKSKRDDGTFSRADFTLCGLVTETVTVLGRAGRIQVGK